MFISSNLSRLCSTKWDILSQGQSETNASRLYLGGPFNRRRVSSSGLRFSLSVLFFLYLKPLQSIFLCVTDRSNHKIDWSDHRHRKMKNTKSKPFSYSESQCTVCPGSSDLFYILTYYIKWVTTSWTYSISVFNTIQ